MQEKEEKIRQMKEAEREKRARDLRARDLNRRHAVEERRKLLEVQEYEKRQQIMAKYKEYEEKLANANRAKRPVYAFGSSTPRKLEYLENLDNSKKVYNTRLTPNTGGPNDSFDETPTSSAAGSGSSARRAVSAISLHRRPLSSSSM